MSHTLKENKSLLSVQWDEILKIAFNINIHSINLAKGKQLRSMRYLVCLCLTVHAPRKRMSRVSITYS